MVKKSKLVTQEKKMQERKMKNWDKKTLSITGGTGSFGQKFLDYVLSTNVKEVRIISRDEFKHDLIKKKYLDDRIKCYVCDVRDYNRIEDCLAGSDYLFHAAALKQVPSCESHPQEAVKTNILGSENTIRAAIKNGLESVVVLSTDKAVQPVNSMGMSKALMEKIALNYSELQNTTRINVTRYGNVLFSRGSVLPFFLNRLTSGQPLTVTDYDMTRFLLPLGYAIDLVEHALFSTSTGSVFVRKSPAASVRTIVESFRQNIESDLSVVDIGVRPGEKIHETLLTEEEMMKAREDEQYYEVSSLFSQRNRRSSYRSDNTIQLDSETLWNLLIKQPEFAEHNHA